MKIVILDAQGGGMGRQLVEGLKKALPNQPLIAVGTNALATAAMLRAASIASASIEPPVWPTLMPRPCMKLSIFCEIFKNATAHRNQMNRFPATPSLPEAET